MPVAVAVAVAIALATSLPVPVHGDFDHDGRPDLAQVVRSEGGDYQLVIRRAAKPSEPAMLQAIHAEDLGSLFIRLAHRGAWRTFCSKGGGADRSACVPRQINLRGDTLAFGTREASEAVAIWTGRQFEVVFLSN